MDIQNLTEWKLRIWPNEKSKSHGMEFCNPVKPSIESAFFHFVFQPYINLKKGQSNISRHRKRTVRSFGSLNNLQLRTARRCLSRFIISEVSWLLRFHLWQGARFLQYFRLVFRDVLSGLVRGAIQSRNNSRRGRKRAFFFPLGPSHRVQRIHNGLGFEAHNVPNP